MATKSEPLDVFTNDHPIFGDVIDDIGQFSKEKLPTKLEVLNLVRGLMKKRQKFPTGPIKREEKVEVYGEVVKLLTEIWQSVGIPVPKFKYARTILEENMESFLQPSKQIRDRILQNDDKRTEFEKKLKTLYNFSRCKCYVRGTNEYRVESFEEVRRSDCKCKAKDKIPCLDFYANQLFSRTLTRDLIPVDELAEIQISPEGKKK